ncbi:hypothetical protein BLNAU_2852 [Blattamonas nauphoetae]|uniref:Uncharacterized protein n=1 Tax=Blattamonas nauphoetae TaxID=2049346 RepID=A0ABQ9YEJ3_9EUKA|nr:hypothetical protein BLNAU_2852 [Blattamonas nauphoetae]
MVFEVEIAQDATTFQVPQSSINQINIYYNPRNGDMRHFGNFIVETFVSYSQIWRSINQYYIDGTQNIIPIKQMYPQQIADMINTVSGCTNEGFRFWFEFEPNAMRQKQYLIMTFIPSAVPATLLNILQHVNTFLGTRDIIKQKALYFGVSTQSFLQNNPQSQMPSIYIQTVQPGNLPASGP